LRVFCAASRNIFTPCRLAQLFYRRRQTTLFLSPINPHFTPMKNILTKLTLALATTVMLSSTAPAAIKRAPQPTPATAATAVADAPTTFAVASRTSTHKAAKFTRAEKRQARKALLKALRDSDDKILHVILAIIFPPLGVALHEDDINSKFWICLLLTFLFYLPGLIYALIVILD